MPYKALAVSRYNKQRRRLAKGVGAELDAVQTAILQDPHRGDRKKDRLRDVWVEKFKADHDQWLVAYEIDPKAQTVTFLAIGQHETSIATSHATVISAWAGGNSSLGGGSVKKRVHEETVPDTPIVISGRSLSRRVGG